MIPVELLPPRWVKTPRDRALTGLNHHAMWAEEARRFFYRRVRERDWWIRYAAREGEMALEDIATATGLTVVEIEDAVALVPAGEAGLNQTEGGVRERGEQ